MKPLEQMGRYATVVIDPPWDYDHEKLFSGMPYEAMPMQDIQDLPIPSVLQDDAFLFLWTVNRFVPEAIRLVGHWDCSYNLLMTWVKNFGVKPPGNPSFNSEFVVVAKHGTPSWQDVREFRAASIWRKRGHSVKPPEFYDLLRRVTPGPRLDIFGRRAIGGFDSWGLESPTVNREPDVYQGVLLD